MINRTYSLILAMGMVAGCAASTELHQHTIASGSPAATLDALFLPPSLDSLPAGLPGEQIRLGYELVVHTQDYAKAYVGNRLNCTNCHLDAGLNPNAASFVGISGRYPEYRARTARRMTLQDRINECLERSMNGTAMPGDSSELAALVAYMEWLSKDVSPGSSMPWRGMPRLTSSRTPNPINGETVLKMKCAFCHGTDGQGTMAAPPLWGPGSYNIAAGMARVTVAASFIKANMPRGWDWSVTDEEAFDLAAFINQQPRPDFPGKVNDWPQGGKPEDVPY